MNHKISIFIDKFKRNKSLFQNFMLIFLSMTGIFLLFALYTYQNSRKIIGEEYKNIGKQSLESLSDYVDNFIMDTRYMMSSLAINDFIRFATSETYQESGSIDYSKRVQEHIMTFQLSNEAIEAIYLYSETSNTIYTAHQHVKLDSFDDRYWMDCLSPNQNGISIFSYAMKQSAPFVICVAKELIVNNNYAVIAFMINPSKLPMLHKIEEKDYQEFYIVSDNGNIIYRYQQESLDEPYDSISHLALYDTTSAEKSLIYSGQDSPYLLLQSHSEEYPWSYVLYVPLQDYVSQLSASRAVLFSISFSLVIFSFLFALLFSFRSLKPVRNIRKFLENPKSQTFEISEKEDDIQYIAQCITQYIQTNKQLADELESRLHLLNKANMSALQSQINPHFLLNTINMMHILATDVLGYEHSLPLMMLDLGKLLRYSLEPTELVTLKEELTYTNIYLAILNKRYGESLRVIHEIDPEVMNARVPKLFIQPIIENSVFHGFSKCHDCECILTIRCTFEAPPLCPGTSPYLNMQIQDNGIGMTSETLSHLQSILENETIPSGKSIGLRNVLQRMNLTYLEQSYLSIESIPGKGSCFTLKFPYIQ